LLAQFSNEYDKILKTEDLKFNNNEIRIYKKYSTSTGLELFRFYEDEHQNWKAEFYETVALKNKKDEITIRTRRSKLNSLKNFELIWAQILETNVSYLPHWETFKYKFITHNHNYEIIDGEITSSSSSGYILDGVSYEVKIKNGKKQNEFNYPNPEFYLKKYPNVDELISFKELLDLLRNDFKIFEK
jgi:hypothetical protein